MGKEADLKQVISETKRCLTELTDHANKCTDELNRFLYPCGCSAATRERYRKDCYYFSDGHYMEGEIATCGKYNKFGYCPCENCNEYLPEFAVRKYVSEHIDEIRKKQNE